LWNVKHFAPHHLDLLIMKSTLDGKLCLKFFFIQHLWIPTAWHQSTCLWVHGIIISTSPCSEKPVLLIQDTETMYVQKHMHTRTHMTIRASEHRLTHGTQNAVDQNVRRPWFSLGSATSLCRLPYAIYSEVLGLC